MEYKNLNKALVPHVISVVEEFITKLRIPHTRIVRPYQWHIIKGGPIAEKKFWTRVSIDMT